MSTQPLRETEGSFFAEQLRDGDPYELANGHPVECLPAGGRHSKSNLGGGLALDTDPAVESAGVDTGFAPDPKNLRAPDIAVGNVPDEPGWVQGAPPLAVEYADTGQDEKNLRNKIETLLAAGTSYVWVVRLVGPRRVEVHERNKPRNVVYAGAQLTAPGVLKNPVPVEALYDREAAHRVALRNLLQRRGYADLDAVLAKGETDLLLRVLQRRVSRVSVEDEQRVRALTSPQRESLGDALAGFRTGDDLADWLDRHS